MLIAALSFSMTVALLMLFGGIAFIGRERDRTEANAAAAAVMLMLMLAAPTVTARFMYEGNAVIATASFWLVFWATWNSLRAIGNVGKTEKKLTTRSGLILAGLNLSFVIAVAAVMYQVA